jgi:hypothetical protein
MLVRAHTLWLPKSGNTPEEYEDAFWPDHVIDREVGAFRCAVADGATETSFSGLWARILVRAWCKGRLEASQMELHLPKLQRIWQRAIGSRPLPWYAEEKVRAGAFASLLGLELSFESSEPCTSGKWRALAVGDTCLFHVRGRRLLCAFPLELSASFGNTPHLVSSKANGNGQLASHLRIADGTWRGGDVFLMLTDALAAWYLRLREQRRAPRLPVVADFEEWVGCQRAARLLKNDDLTAMRVEVW